jgi:hypothetical protein
MSASGWSNAAHAVNEPPEAFVIVAHPCIRLVSAFETAPIVTTVASASHGSAPRRRSEGSHAAASQPNVIGAARALGLKQV